MKAIKTTKGYYQFDIQQKSERKKQIEQAINYQVITMVITLKNQENKKASQSPYLQAL